MLKQHIEALIFSADHPVQLEDIKECIVKTLAMELREEELISILEELKLKYQSDDFSFELMQIAEGYQFLTKPTHHNFISTYLNQKSNKKLSTAALETLAIIAYKQPISKSEAEQIRGVNCDYTIQKLLEKELIAISGRSETPGKPLLYSTSPLFMEYFGINSVKDLPKLKEFSPQEENTVGLPNEN